MHCVDDDVHFNCIQYIAFEIFRVLLSVNKLYRLAKYAIQTIVIDKKWFSCIFIHVQSGILVSTCCIKHNFAKIKKKYDKYF